MFKFSGWHPHCLCYTIPILKTEDEFLSLDDTKPSVNAVTDTPANFKQWVRDNKERIEAASERGKLPYFLRDNMDAWGKVVYPDFYGTINHKNNTQKIINNNNYQSIQETILQSDNYSYVDRYIGQSIVKKLYENKTVRMLKTIEDSASIETLKSSAEKAFYKALGNKVTITINEDLISLDIARNHLYELLSIVREYNLKQGTLEEIILGYIPEDDNEYGVTTTNEQTFNRTIKLTNSIPMRSNLDAIYNSRCDENRIQFSLATHECGHLLFNCNIAKNSEIFLAHEFESIYLNYRKEIIQLANNGNLDELSNILIGDRGSYYNLNEFIAECFQEYRNSSNPSKYSIIIGNLIDSNFKKK